MPERPDRGAERPSRASEEGFSRQLERAGRAPEPERTAPEDPSESRPTEEGPARDPREPRAEASDDSRRSRAAEPESPDGGPEPASDAPSSLATGEPLLALLGASPPAPQVGAAGESPLPGAEAAPAAALPAGPARAPAQTEEAVAPSALEAALLDEAAGPAREPRTEGRSPQPGEARDGAGLASAADARRASAPEGASRPESAPAPRGPDPAALERAADVLRQIRLELRPETREAVIQLRPLELGRIAIRVELDERGARAELRAERAATLEVLARHVPELRAALERNGIVPEHVELRLGFEDFGAGRGGAQDAHRGTPRPARPRAPVGPTTPAPAALVNALAGASGIDLYA